MLLTATSHRSVFLVSVLTLLVFLILASTFPTELSRNSTVARALLYLCASAAVAMLIAYATRAKLSIARGVIFSLVAGVGTFYGVRDPSLAPLSLFITVVFGWGYGCMAIFLSE